eukprot:SAG11_NODE_707_length_7651_cov_4.133872_5_plen_100_part_00
MIFLPLTLGMHWRFLLCGEARVLLSDRLRESTRVLPLASSGVMVGGGAEVAAVGVTDEFAEKELALVETLAANIVTPSCCSAIATGEHSCDDCPQHPIS